MGDAGARPDVNDRGCCGWGRGRSTGQGGSLTSEPSLGRSRALGPDGKLRSSRKQLNAEPREYAH